MTSIASSLTMLPASETQPSDGSSIDLEGQTLGPPLEQVSKPPRRKGSNTADPAQPYTPMIWSRAMFRAYYLLTLASLVTELVTFVVIKPWLVVWLSCLALYPLLLLAFLSIAIFSKLRGMKKSILPWQFTPIQLCIMLFISETTASVMLLAASFISPIIATICIPLSSIVCFLLSLVLLSYWHPDFPTKIALPAARSKALRFAPSGQKASIYVVHELASLNARLNVVLDWQWIAQVLTPHCLWFDVQPGTHTLVLSLAGVHSLFHEQAHVSLDLAAGEIAVLVVTMPRLWSRPVSVRTMEDTPEMRAMLESTCMTVPWKPIVTSPVLPLSPPPSPPSRSANSSTSQLSVSQDELAVVVVPPERSPTQVRWQSDCAHETQGLVRDEELPLVAAVS